MDNYIFSIEMQVRDYELDAEGIVNNANYLHYLEHTRHQFCTQNGISFAEMQERGIIPVLNKVEIEYKTPLRSGDSFVSKLNLERKGARFVFRQDLFKTDGTPVVKALVSCVCLSGGKLDRGDMLAGIFKDFLK
ncbi:MAG TPA: acyl-CoA thioesterase [Candidatus Limisoma gallistercoris]|nr:acyl-CoA thioesterase [Candidatus Limisoma gallistercoris]